MEKKGNPKRRPKRDKAQGTCPRCGQPTEQILECPACHREGCTERCITGGKGTSCNECDDKGPLVPDDEDGEGPDPGEEE